MSRVLLVSVVLSCVATSVVAGDTSATYVLPLTVLDAQGIPVVGLTSEQLQLKGVEGRATLTADDGPRRIILLLDVSSSMGSASSGPLGKWNRAKGFITEFVSAKRPHDKVALHVYAGRYKVLTPLDASSDQILAALDDLPVPGASQSKKRFEHWTMFLDALKASLETNLQFGDAIVVIADDVNEDRRSKSKLEGVMKTATALGVRVYSVNVEQPFAGPPETGGPVVGGLGAPPSPVEDPASGIEPYDTWIRRRGSQRGGLLLRKVAQATGGQSISIWMGATYYPARNQFHMPAGALRESGRELHASIGALYRLELKAMSPLKKRKGIDIRITRSGKVRDDLRVYHPRQLYPAER